MAELTQTTCNLTHDHHDCIRALYLSRNNKDWKTIADVCPAQEIDCDLKDHECHFFHLLICHFRSGQSGQRACRFGSGCRIWSKYLGQILANPEKFIRDSEDHCHMKGHGNLRQGRKFYHGTQPTQPFQSTQSKTAIYVPGVIITDETQYNESMNVSCNGAPFMPFRAYVEWLRKQGTQITPTFIDPNNI